MCSNNSSIDSPFFCPSITLKLFQLLKFPIALLISFNVLKIILFVNFSAILMWVFALQADWTPFRIGLPELYFSCPFWDYHTDPERTKNIDSIKKGNFQNIFLNPFLYFIHWFVTGVSMKLNSALIIFRHFRHYHCFYLLLNGWFLKCKARKISLLTATSNSA